MSKAATAALVLVAIPLARRSLDADDFSTLARAATMLGWATQFNLGVGPANTLGIADAMANSSQSAARRMTSATFAVAAGTGGVVASLFLGLSVSSGAVRAIPELSTEVWLVLMALALSLPLGNATYACFAGLREVHRTNLFHVAGTLLAVGVTVVVSTRASSPTLFLLAIYATPLVGYSLAGVDLWRRHPWIMPSVADLRFRTVVQVGRENASFSVQQVAGWLALQSSILFAAANEAAADLYVLISLMPIALGTINAVLLPAMPLIRESEVANDWRWIRELSRRLTVLVLAISIVGLVVAVTVGPDLFTRIYGGATHPGSTVLVSAVLTFGGMALIYVDLNVLIALRRRGMATIGMALNAGLAGWSYWTVPESGTTSTYLIRGALATVPTVVFFRILLRRNLAAVDHRS